MSSKFTSILHFVVAACSQ